VEKAFRYGGIALARIMLALSAVAVWVGPASAADPPSNDELIRPLPVITPTPTNWVPKFPFPYDQTRRLVTDADINAEREMCQWYNAQYEILSDQIDRLQFNRLQQNAPGVRIGAATDWDYTFGPIQHQADIVTANIDQTEAFLAPRAQALTQSQDYVGDNKWPLYQGESFYLLWQQLSNVGNGIKAHQADWFTGPSVQRVKLWGSRINRSHVCR
jgi:hypothetical protein